MQSQGVKNKKAAFT